MSASTGRAVGVQRLMGLSGLGFAAVFATSYVVMSILRGRSGSVVLGAMAGAAAVLITADLIWRRHQA
ncbi:MAG TPA: hypothetical protein VIJ47_07930 [Acidimicrobiales bacterium]